MAGAAAEPHLEIELDAEGHVLRFPPPCEAATGWSEDDVAGRRYWDFLVPDHDVAAVRAAFAAAKAAGDGPPVQLRHDLQGRGRTVRVDWELRPVPGDAGAVAAVVLRGRRDAGGAGGAGGGGGAA